MTVIELANGHLVQIEDNHECKVGGVNWPLCALGMEMHRECLPSEIRDQALRSRPGKLPHTGRP